MKDIMESIICAGFGGQGVMVLGRFLANAGMAEGHNVTWLPSYGVEVRGGTAHSSVYISSGLIASPVVANPNAALIMNGPSLYKFEDRLQKGGLLILNTSMAGRSPKRKDLDTVEYPLTDEAIKIGNIKVANMIAAGIYAGKKKLFAKDVLMSTVEQMAGRC